MPTDRPLPIRAQARVAANVRESEENWRLELSVPDWPGAEPGQFVMLSPGAESDVSRTDPLLPRPMAVYRFEPGENATTRVDVLYKLEGRGTRLLSEALPGQRVRVVGPLGRSFSLPPAGTTALLVGGGTGIASLYALAAAARRQGDVAVVLGARRAEALMAVSDFEALGVDLRLTTEDGSAGQRGRVTDALEAAVGGRASVRIYACGPTPMMHAVARWAAERGFGCEVSLENPMACGFGVCLGCAAPLAAGGYALVCRDGPVFEASQIAWEG
ncbi:MAG: dihydroorotate dehydrogenase electron transfer subunit, partial [Proteobacteria bacterium]|nr:dihydroorotate dehydrogenase electron transfer subunit [Pseudomonadota bacterium]